MVGSSVESSNQIFEVLDDWNVQLKALDRDLGGPEL